ncbi:MarR family transcriptional regulator [Longibacter salinarum]|uniref:MarR family transcriptional regulator n=1 Tax=Longibacter salinarum TaxID=1850348 RepID=A0A2A8CY28_9BACT|nr:MarR family transcriptional regulator [Longibacter salinarum]PEN13288.1 MarR family transcriptional regulator [Longibacter salinarum]
MASDLQNELHQTKPFSSVETEAVLSILRTAGLLEGEITEALKPHDLTPTQYNVLRILRGAQDGGLCRYEVSDRLLTPGPDVTRLLDRLEESGFVRRAKDPADRRRVRAHITEDGLNVLDELDNVLNTLHQRQLDNLDDGELQTLIDLLARARR